MHCWQEINWQFSEKALFEMRFPSGPLSEICSFITFRVALVNIY